MRALLAELGDPQRAFPAIHVVGTNGKSTATRHDRRVAPRGRAARRRLHVAARLRLARAARHRRRTDFERAVARVAARGRALGATQFEALTAAALAEFAAARCRRGGRRGGPRGRLDATNVLDAPRRRAHERRRSTTPTARGHARADRPREARGRPRPASTVASASPSGWRSLASEGPVVVGADDVGRAAAEQFLGRPSSSGEVEVSIPGSARLLRRQRLCRRAQSRRRRVARRPASA